MPDMKYITTINGKKFEVDIRNDGSVWVGGKRREVDFLALGPTLYSIIMDTVQHEIVVESEEDSVEVLISGRLYTGSVLDERTQLMLSRRGGLQADSGEVTIRAPMPGLIAVVLCKEGDAVEAGQTLVILESMKMQNELKAPRAGTVQRVSVSDGQTVEQRKVLVTLT
ncbi:MAG: acetyl-CoA carboxylase biotin carboxyl carrier protein subunit [Chloroflexi bacterium]|nr:acetyl-CoA carboxylase biotin carboxyl carrier protein subunit [Chloroflexota bacterium]